MWRFEFSQYGHRKGRKYREPWGATRHPKRGKTSRFRGGWNR